jgi:probable phosphoglycerate mutase
MIRLYLVRHAQTELNKEHKVQGWIDSPLTDLGKEQARILSRKFKDKEFKAVYTSTLGRTKKTAKIICKNKNSPIYHLEDLKEMSFGRWEGVSFEGTMEHESYDFYYFWKKPEFYNPESGESFFDVAERAIKAIRKIIETEKEGDILVISHSIVIRLLICYFEGKGVENVWRTPYILPTSLTMVYIYEDSHRIIDYADDSHLEELIPILRM